MVCCSKCGTEYRAGNKYCEKCGSILLLRERKKRKHHPFIIVGKISLLAIILIMVGIIPFQHLVEKNFAIKQTKELSVGPRVDEYSYFVAFSPDGKYLASAGLDGIIIWRIDTFKKETFLWGEMNIFRINIDCLYVAFSLDGKYLVRDGGSTIGIYDTSTFEKLASLTGHNGRVRSVAFSPNGRYLSSGSDDKTIKIWDMNEFKEALTLDTGGLLKDKKHGVNSVAFSPNDKYMASGNDSEMVVVWDTGSFKEQRLLNSCRYGVNSVAFSHTGQYLAGGCDDGMIEIWDMKTFEKIKQIKGDKLSVHFATFSPEGKYLASVGTENTIKIWSQNNFVKLDTLKGHTAQVYCVAFSRDGRYMASGSADGTVRLWRIPRYFNLLSENNREWLFQVLKSAHAFIDFLAKRLSEMVKKTTN